MRTTDFDIVGIGENATDKVILLPCFPASDSKIKILSSEIRLGGQVATAMVACGKWGLRTCYVGAIGDDQSGELHRQALNQAGVEAYLTVVPDCQSQLSVVLVDERTGQRTVLWQRDPRLSLPRSALRKSWVASAGLLYVDGHDPQTTQVAAQWAREAGIPVVADLDSYSEDLLSLLPLLDYPISSRGFIEQASGEQDLLRALPELQAKFGFHFICATLGDGGALAWDGQRFWYSSSYLVRAIDTTGAGDLFHAGFSYGVLKAWDWQRVMDFSCAAAGLNCTALGAREGIRSLDDIEAFLRDAQRNTPAYSSVQLEGAAAQAARRAGGAGRQRHARQLPARAIGK